LLLTHRAYIRLILCVAYFAAKCFHLPRDLLSETLCAIASVTLVVSVSTRIPIRKHGVVAKLVLQVLHVEIIVELLGLHLVLPSWHVHVLVVFTMRCGIVVLNTLVL